MPEKHCFNGRRVLLVCCVNATQHTHSLGHSSFDVGARMNYATDVIRLDRGDGLKPMPQWFLRTKKAIQCCHELALAIFGLIMLLTTMWRILKGHL
jgi:hypothetical protein